MCSYLDIGLSHEYFYRRFMGILFRVYGCVEDCNVTGSATSKRYKRRDGGTLMYRGVITHHVAIPLVAQGLPIIHPLSVRYNGQLS